VNRVFVYFHKNLNIGYKIIECTVTSVEGSVTYPNLTTRVISIDGISVKFILPKNHTQEQNQSFYIRFNEEKSRRGENYTGFLTIEDALEFAEFLKDQKIENLQNEINRAEESYSKLLISFEK
jgi:hypothetical protein